MFTNPNGGTGYLFGAKLPSAHVNLVWQYIAKALDGDAGGTYTLSAQLILQGSGLKLAGANHQIGGTLTVLSGGFLTVAVGGVERVDGTVNVRTGGSIAIDAGGSIAWTAGSTESGTKTDSTTTTHSGIRVNTGGDVPNTAELAFTDLNTPFSLAPGGVSELFITDVTVTGTVAALQLVGTGVGATDTLLTGFILHVHMTGATGTDNVEVFVDPDLVTPVVTMTRTTAAYTKWRWTGSTWKRVLTLAQ